MVESYVEWSRLPWLHSRPGRSPRVHISEKMWQEVKQRLNPKPGRGSRAPALFDLALTVLFAVVDSPEVRPEAIEEAGLAIACLVPFDKQAPDKLRNIASNLEALARVLRSEAEETEEALAWRGG